MKGAGPCAICGGTSCATKHRTSALKKTRHTETYPTSSVITLTEEGLRIVHRIVSKGIRSTRIVVYSQMDGSVQIHPTSSGIRVSCPGSKIFGLTSPNVMCRGVWIREGWSIFQMVKANPKLDLKKELAPPKFTIGVGVEMLDMS